jgi:hypothetical protein
MVPATVTIFSDIEVFKPYALPVLHADIASNTVALSELHGLNQSTPGIFLSTCSCTGCSSTAVVFCTGSSSDSGNLFYSNSRLLISTGLCKHAAQVVAAELQGLQWSSLTAPGASAAALCEVGGLSMQLVQQMNLMVLNAQHAPHAAGFEATAVGLAEGQEAEASSGVEQQQQQQQQQQHNAGSSNSIRLPLPCSSAAAAAPDGSKQLQALSAASTKDMQLLHSWFSGFIQEAMHSTTPASDSQINALLQPWLQQGQFHVLQAAGHPVCLLCDVPTTSSSTRIVLVYTPQEHRRKGHARAAGGWFRLVLCTAAWGTCYRYASVCHEASAMSAALLRCAGTAMCATSDTAPTFKRRQRCTPHAWFVCGTNHRCTHASVADRCVANTLPHVMLLQCLSCAGCCQCATATSASWPARRMLQPTACTR